MVARDGIDRRRQPFQGCAPPCFGLAHETRTTGKPTRRIDSCAILRLNGRFHCWRRINQERTSRRWASWGWSRWHTG